MIEKTKTFFVVLIYLNIVYCSEILLNEIILKTDLEFKKVSDFKAKMTVELNVPIKNAQKGISRILQASK